MPKRLSIFVIAIGLAVFGAGCDSSNAVATVTARAAATNMINATLSPVAVTAAATGPVSVPAVAATVAQPVSSAVVTSAATVQPTPLGGLTSGPTNPPGATATVTPGASAAVTFAATGLATLQTTPLGGPTSALTNLPNVTATLSPAPASPTTVAATQAVTALITANATAAATASPTFSLLLPPTSTPAAATVPATAPPTLPATAAAIAPLTGAVSHADTRWFNDAILYSVFVCSFRDSNGDGIGDLQGVIDGLDYIQSLGVNTIWLLPVFKSPSYHGYDISDYYTVNPDYGTNADLLRLIREVHKRHMRILLDYVVNHTSNQNAFFKDAFGNPASQYSDFYTWLNPAHTQYATFASVKEMSQLNYDSPKVRQFAIDVALHWMDPLGNGDLSAGVDGYRCDVATGPPHDFWMQLRAAMTAKNPQSLLLGEIWVSAPKTIQSYFDGDQFDAAFDFPLYMALGGSPDKDGDGALAGNVPGLVSGLIRAGQKLYSPNAHLVRFINNHDTNRILSDVNGDMSRARAAAVFELTVPGTPVIYYGEELGMKGDKGGPPWYDAYRREPLPWIANLKGAGQTTWFTPPDANDRPNSGISVEEENGKPDSLLSLYRMLGTLRADHDALRSGQYDVPTLATDQRDLYVLRSWNGGELFVIVINFSKKAIMWTPGDVFTVNGTHYATAPNSLTLSQGIAADGANWTLQPAGYGVFRATSAF